MNKKTTGFKIFIICLLILNIPMIFILSIYFLNIMPSAVLDSYLSAIGTFNIAYALILSIVELIAIYGIWKIKNWGFMIGIVAFGISFILSIIYINIGSILLYGIIICFLGMYRKKYIK